MRLTRYPPVGASFMILAMSPIISGSRMRLTILSNGKAS